MDANAQLLEVIRLGHPVLRHVAEPVPEDWFSSTRLVNLGRDIIRTMIEENGVGLAAPQVAESLRLFAFWVPETEDEPEKEDSILDDSIETLELSIRSMNCLKNANIRTLRDLVSRSEKEMVEIRNFGEKSLKEVRSKLEVMGLGFGMNLDL